MKFHYHNKKFRPISGSPNSETTQETIFVYQQEQNVLTSEYSGGEILKGHLIGLVNDDGSIEMCYHQVNLSGELMTGICFSKPELLPNGKIRLHERWKWTSGDFSEGESVLEED
ncbi:hypothetical protein [Pedobacter arcticus]|uniref:hypothetical protein n=1 Tax=Pedobacter arcticus TaxID=752140 RepID=UPI0002E49BED|nr:hypothetical protein [Pedobacter arcticus]